MEGLVCRLTNSDLEFQYDVFKQVINKPELLEVPVAIYSIAGPTKTGKSYLLNVFYHLLKSSQQRTDQVDKSILPL